MSVIPLILNLADELNGIGNIGPYDDEELTMKIFRPDLRMARSSRSMGYPARFRNLPYFVRKVEKTKQPDEAGLVGKDGFQVCLDVQQFKPNELTVKTVDNMIVIEGNHEEREDHHGSISRHFVRKYTIPKGYDAKDVVSMLSSDGVLTVKAPPPTKSEEANERIVQIQQTGPAHLTVKENPKKEGAENGEKSSNEKMED